MAKLTLFYDGYCPLCVKEMRKLASFDSRTVLQFEDIQAPNFSQRYPDVDKQEANRVLLGVDDHGNWLRGLDVSLLAWTLVGKGKRVALLRWRRARPLLDWGYRFFARHRYRISGLLTGRQRCQRCEVRSCRVDG